MVVIETENVRSSIIIETLSDPLVSKLWKHPTPRNILSELLYSSAARGYYKKACVLTTTRRNSILVVSCPFKVSKYICMSAALKFLVGSCQHVFRKYYYKTVLLSKRLYFKFNFRKNNLDHQKARKKLHLKHLNGHLKFSRS